MHVLKNKKFWLLICFFIKLLPAVVLAEETVQIITQKDLPNNLGSYRHLQVELEQPIGTVHLHVATLNNHYRASFYQQTEEQQSLAKFLDQVAQQEEVPLAINGGFYTRDFKPAGLFKLQGHVLRSLARDSVLNACLGIDKKQKLFLGETRDNCMQFYNALQAGPVLIDDGKISNNLEILEQKLQKSRAFFMARRRTVIAKTKDNKIVMAVTSPVRLGDLAYILQKYASNMGVGEIDTAVGLDGGSSTGMFIQFDEQPFYYPELKHVKTMVFFH